jgi:uncharacterized protein (TIGR03437 family)
METCPISLNTLEAAVVPHLGRFCHSRCVFRAGFPIPFLAVLVLSGTAAGQTAATSLAHFTDTTIEAARVDTSGNIYIAGFQGDPTIPDGEDAFVSKLYPDGSVSYTVTIGGSKQDYAVALAIDSSGAAYIYGQTASTDFPATSGALQTAAGSSSPLGFVAKVSPQGKIVYATLLGGDSEVYPSAGGLLVDSAGQVTVSGQTIYGNFPGSSGAPFTSTDTNTFFVVKVDSAGANIVSALRGLGGQLATDDQGNIYVAGLNARGTNALPVTSGAFQSTYSLQVCGGGGQIVQYCDYPYVTKLSPDLTQIVYLTYVSGSWGAKPSALFVDQQYNVLLAGTTNSPDYPATADAFEPLYIANAPPPPLNCLYACVFPPPATGYFTKLNANGTGLVYSTFLGGTQTDTISFAALSEDGIYLSGQASSDDFPGLAGVPSKCLPATVETRLSLDGSSVSAARIVPGQVLAYDPVTNTLLAWTGTDLVSFDPSAPPAAITCILDSADLHPVTAIAPGELVSIYGPFFLNGVGVSASGGFPRSLDGVQVTFSGINGPLLYVSSQQINVQAPFEIAGASQVSLTVNSSEFNQADSVTLPVTARNPTAFLDDTFTSTVLAGCSVSGQQYQGGPVALALNSDGSRNSCANPARGGSVVTIFLSGLGVTTPALATGTVNSSPGVALNLPVTLSSGTATVVSAEALPGSISGVWEVQLMLPTSPTGAVTLSLAVDSIPLRDGAMTIWVR